MRILDILQAPWAIHREKLTEIHELYYAHTRREKLDLSAWSAITGREPGEQRQAYTLENGVATLPIHGVLTKADSAWNRFCGMTSTQQIGKDLQTALDDSSVKSILLHIDSPGGQVDGTPELSRTIHAARGQKPIVALADGTMASAAYWIGAAADAVYMTGPTVQVGSIGVVATHVDRSKIDPSTSATTEITAGKYKRIASQNGPLTDEGRSEIQGQVDEIYRVFVDDIARFRDTSVEDVLTRMADGRIFVGAKAQDAGLVDGVFTLAQLQAALADGLMPKAQTGAGAALSTLTETQGDPMDIQQLKAAHGDLAEQLLAEGRAQGAQAELSRIQGCLAAALPGYEQIAQDKAFDGSSQPGDVALAILDAQRQTRARAQAQAEEGPEPIPAGEDPEQKDEEQRQEEQQQEDTPEARWGKDANLRAEFANNFNAFAAYEKAVAKGTVRIQKGA